MEMHKGVAAFHARSQARWRQWLKANHQSVQSVWLIIFKKASGIPSVKYSEAVDEALCFGWIDSKPNKRDDKSYYQFFAKRNPKSNWSRLNKQKVSNLLNSGRMQESGLEMISIAKRNGTWEALNEVEDLIEPKELQERFSKNKTAKENWEGFPSSARRGILEWIQQAKKAETRKKRVETTVALAEKGIRANQYNPVKSK